MTIIIWMIFAFYLTWWEKIFGYCHECGMYGDVKWRRQSTQYQTEDHNWTKCCENCFEWHEETIEYQYREMYASSFSWF